MTSQISGPCCASDIKPDQYKSFVWESHVRQQIFVVLKIFIVKRNKIQLGFDNIYSQNNQDNVKHGKNVQMSDFISYAASEYWGYVKMCGEQGFKAVHEKVH